MSHFVAGVVKRPVRAAVLIALTLAAVLAGLSAAQGAPPAGDLDQCANDPVATPSHCDVLANQWQNGNLNANQAHYLEGDSVPYRLRLSNLDVAKTHTVTIAWDTTKGGKHALDYLTSFDRTEPLANPCLGVTGCDLAGAKDTYPIPEDPAVSAEGVIQVPGDFTLFNGSITSLSAYAMYAGSYAGDSATKITISFTTTVANPVLAWGGHIAERADWGQTSSAVSISGSPFHMRLIDIDGKGGNQDRSLSNDAVIYPASISVVKDALPDSSRDFAFVTTGGGLSAFSLDDDSDLTLSNTQVFNDIVNFDTKTVTESDPRPDFALTDIVCTEDLAQDSAASVDTRTAAISLQEAENVVCTFTNVLEPGTLRVIKNVVNDNGGTAAAGDSSLHVRDASGDVPDSPAPGSDLGTVYTLPPATYSVAESGIPTGYQQRGFSGDCDGAGNVTVVPSQEKVCIITNDDIPPRLSVVKHVINDHGGGASASDFSMHVAGANADPASFPGDEAGTPVALDAGSYSVTESGPSGYAASFSDDCSGAIALGEVRTCTVTNDDIEPTLLVIKHVINDDGGSADASDFIMSVAGANASPGSFSGDEAGTSVTLQAGAYSVSEDGPAGYAASLSADCSGVISLGEVKTCTVTNDDIQPRLTVYKHVINDNGGAADASDFTMTVNGSSGGPASFAGDEGGTVVGLEAGAYSVSESGPSGYAASFTDDCAGTIALAEVRTCTVTNDDIQPRLVVIKHLVNDSGGTAAASDFAMSVSGPSAAPASFAGDEAGTNVALNAGSYEVSESTVSGYTQTSADGCSGSIDIGEIKTCTFTNDDIQPRLIVFKHVINDNGGTAASEDFTMRVSGSEADPETFPGYEAGTMVEVNAGSYSVSEDGPSAYDASFSTGCSGTIALGEMKACFVTNDDSRATPRIRTAQKWTLNDTAVLSNIRAGAPDAAEATVLFTLFRDADCEVEVFSESASTIDNSAETSIGSTTTTPGTYYWTAFYSGDSYNEPRLSDCGSEVTTITAVQPIPD